jgi:hypothetical protein
MTRIDPSNEASRQTPYRRLYTKIHRFKGEVARQDSCISYLLNEIRTLQKRVEKLEVYNANLVKLAQEHMDGVRGMEQRGDLPLQKT